MADIEIGTGKPARRGYGLDEVAIVPSRRTRDPGDVDISWRVDAFDFSVPFMAEPVDGVVSPAVAIEISRLGGLAPIDLEGLWTRHENPEPLLAEIATLDPLTATRRLQELYLAPVRPDLIKARLAEISAAGVVACGALTPQRAEQLAPAVLEAEIDVLIIRGSVVSAEHVSKGIDEPLNLKRFIRELDIPIIVGRCMSHQAALHLMRTGAVGVLAGLGTGQASRDALGLGGPFATAIADAAGARSRHLEETGVYVQVIADGHVKNSGEIAKAIACGADAVMVGPLLAQATNAPAQGNYWPRSATHQDLPRGHTQQVHAAGSLEEVLFGPAHEGEGRTNLAGALRMSMALCGYRSVREFHKADVIVGSVS